MWNECQGGVQEIRWENRKDLWHTSSRFFSPGKVRILSAEPHRAEMYEIPCCAVLQLLPSMFTPELAQTLTACPVGPSLIQPLPAAPLQTGAWLSHTTPRKMPLSCSISLRVPSGWRKMYSLLGYWCLRHLNSDRSSFPPCPRPSVWPYDWTHACVKISREESNSIITGCGDQDVDGLLYPGILLKDGEHVMSCKYKWLNRHISHVHIRGDYCCKAISGFISGLQSLARGEDDSFTDQRCVHAEDAMF